MYVLSIHMELKPDKAEEYKKKILAEVEHAMEMEAGILGFHVWEDDEKPQNVTIYEVYRDEEALQFHHKQAYFNEFVQSTRDYIVSVTSRRGKTLTKMGRDGGMWTNARHAKVPSLAS